MNHGSTLLLCTSLVAALLAGCAAAPERQAWVAEFDELLAHMGVAYANLEYADHQQGLDLPALAAEARRDLQGCSTGWGARRVVGRFLTSFEDGHLRAERLQDSTAGEPSPNAATAFPTGLPPDEALDRMGFRQEDHGHRGPVPSLPGFRRFHPPQDNAFAWGLFELPGGELVGAVRIGAFGEERYRDRVGPLWAEFAAQRDEPCDLACEWEFRRVASNRLLADLARGARALREAGATKLLVDVRGNGGGTDWAAVAPRVLAPPLEACPEVALVRHEHHAGRLRSRLEWLDQLEPGSAPEGGLLDRAREQLREQLTELERPCDQSPRFEGHDPGCRQLAASPGCGLLAYLPPGALAGVSWRSSVFHPLRFEYEEAAWDGPLYVLQDRHSASATEHFLSLLQANGAATLLGERTPGAGCGYIGGGIPIELPALGLLVRMPDCARFTADGRNEREGIAPDRPIDPGDTAAILKALR